MEKKKPNPTDHVSIPDVYSIKDGKEAFSHIDGCLTM